MNVITFDLELNQPSRKIIQIGYTINNVKTGKMLLLKSIYINPGESIAPAIVELTGIRQSIIDDMGTTLEKAYEIMSKDIKKYQTSSHPLQWGLDHYELRKQLNLSWEDFVFSPRAIDVKSLYQAYAMSKPQGKTVAGLGKACEVLGLEFEGEAHNALCDSVNTFKVFKSLTNKMTGYDRVVKAIKND